MTKLSTLDVKIIADSQGFINAIIDKIKSQANNSIGLRNNFNIVLCGGDTPINIYKKLKDIDTDWKLWNIWICDERVGNYNDTNVKTIVDNFLNFLNISQENLHFFKFDVEMEKSTQHYIHELKSLGVFDLVLLGVGADGHTASLFPGNDWGLTSDSPNIIQVYNSPKPPSSRLSLSGNRLCRSKEIIFIAKGRKKLDIVNKMINRDELQLNSIRGIKQTTLYYCLEE